MRTRTKVHTWSGGASYKVAQASRLCKYEHRRDACATLDEAHKCRKAPRPTLRERGLLDGDDRVVEGVPVHEFSWFAP